MSKARLVITALFLEKQAPAKVATRYRATPAVLYNELPKALPGPSRVADSHDRVDKSGTVTLRVYGKLRHIGVGRTHKGTHIILLVQDLEVRVVNAITGELLRELTINPDRDYQPRNPK